MRKTAYAIIVPFLSAIAGGVAIIGAADIGLAGIDRQMNVKMVEIAVNILSEEPKDNIAPAREWAVAVIDHYAKVPLSPQAQAALVKNKALARGYYTRDYAYPDMGYDYGGYDYGAPRPASPKK